MSDNNETVRSALVAEVSRRWATGQQPTLLSQIGKLFGSDLRQLANGRKLLDVLQNDFAESLRVTALGDGAAKVWAATPVEANETTVRRALEAAIGTSTDSDVSPRYDRAIWAAFRSPLSIQHQRHVYSLDNSYRFRDLPVSEPKPQNTVFSLYHSDVASQEATPGEVVEKIKSYFARNGQLPAPQLIERPLAPDRRAPQTSTYRHSQHLLGAVLAALSQGEQRRVTLPLDVVAKLLDTPVD